MHQNRINPQGQIISTSARGAWMGNRGLLHDEKKNIVRPHRLKAWLICVLEFKGRKREIMKSDRYTELFFFDEATAFSAGHRPCFECRRKDFERFKSLWIKANPEHHFNEKTPIREIDQLIHNERINTDGSKIRFDARVGELPNGTFIEHEGKSYVLADKFLYRWTPFGYDRKIQLPFDAEVKVLTPASTVKTFRAGYTPQILFSADSTLAIVADMESIENNERLYQEKNFNLRSAALDNIEFHIIDRINALAENTTSKGHLNHLKDRALKIKNRLEEVNEGMFRRLRVKISMERIRGKSLMELINEYFDHGIKNFLRQDTTGYDNLDLFFNGLLFNQNPPDELQEREPGMIYYQKTPARIILELIERASFKREDVFFDLGSGLGQVSMMVNLFGSVISKGVEIEPAFCQYARSCAADLNLTGVEFIHSDARSAHYSSGTVFFLYTPFEGKMLQETLQVLKHEAKKRKIKIFTFGPCTSSVANENWLKNIFNIKTSSGEFAGFHSI